MSMIYNIFIEIAYFFLKIAALFNKKIQLFISGRKDSFSKLSALTESDSVIWFHAASLGEFEQGRPIIEHLKNQYPSYKIVVTFFSPSGYEIRQNYPHADVICYLPFDTRRNMRKFVKLVHPKLAVIIKYEFWPNLLTELYQHNIKTILVSGIFRKKQSFFKWYGSFMIKKLRAFNHFFVQNQNSKDLLNSINYRNVTVCGDTRFDRVSEILQQNNTLDFIGNFKNDCYTVVAGSTWQEDEDLLVHYINHYATDNEKFIIAPHTTSPERIKELTAIINKKNILYSEKEGVSLQDYQVLIIDTIGILTKIYSYADLAYVGGGLATGLHNILEPATYGIPVIFGGHKFKKFQEAKDLLTLKGAATVHDKKDFCTIFADLRNNKTLRNQMGKISYDYIQSNTGATQKILEYIKTTL